MRRIDCYLSLEIGNKEGSRVKEKRLNWNENNLEEEKLQNNRETIIRVIVVGITVLLVILLFVHFNLLGGFWNLLVPRR